MREHAVVIAGGGPTGMMLAGELALADVDVAVVERRASAELVGSRAGGLHARTIEVFDQRGIADRFLSEGQTHPVVHFHVPLDISDFPTRHNYVLGLFQNHIERILAEWIGELGARAPLDDGDVHARQRQLARQHHARRPAAGDHHRMLAHRHPPQRFTHRPEGPVEASDARAPPGACRKSRGALQVVGGGEGAAS